VAPESGEGVSALTLRKKRFFEKKRAKNFYDSGALPFSNAMPQRNQSFFCFFFVHKKEVLS
jgi:hypothetical protein